MMRHRWQQRLALWLTSLFVWTFVLATPVTGLAHASPPRNLGIRPLSPQEMSKMLGTQSPPPAHATSTSSASGGTYPWESTVAGVNTGNGNKLTTVPIVGWTQLGGLPVNFTLYHNSQGNHNSELGQKWTFSYDMYLVTAAGGGGLPPPGSVGNVAVHWGNDLSYIFPNLGSNVFGSPTGIYDTLICNVDTTYTLTTKNQVKYHFATSLYCDSITDENGNTISIAHNIGGYVTSITDASSRVILLSYDSSSRISTITDPLSRVWTLAYDSSNNLSSVTYPALSGSSYSESFTYNSAHDITQITSPAGRTESFTYNAADDSLASQTDGCSNTTTFSYTATDTTITDANSHSVDYTYASGRVSLVTDNLSHTVTPTYDSNNNVTQQTDQRGKNWNYTFDSSGNVLTTSDPYGNGETITYNSHNKPLTIEDGNGHTKTLTYDSHDNLLTSEDANSHTTTYTYSTDGLLSTKEDANSHTITYGYDGDGNLTNVEDANGHTTDFTVNGLGWRTATTDPLSHSTSVSYDNWGRVTSVTTPAGTTSTTYDHDSNVLTIVDGNSHTATTNTYDNDDRLLTATKANGDEMQYSYDGTGQKGLLSSSTDGNSHTTSYSYTSLNQKSSVTYPDSSSESWTYDNTGNVISHTDCNAHTIDYTFDNAGKLITVTYPDTTTVGYVYDAGDHLTSMTDSTGTTGYTYDAGDRETQIAAPNGTVGYGYDAGNRRTSMSLTGTGSWAYTYDAGDRLLTTTNPNSEVTTNSFDIANRLTSVTNGDSTVANYSYDTANRLTEIQTLNSSSAVLADYQYTYNAVDVATQTDSDGTVTTYGFDASDQLTSEVRDNTHSTGYSISYTYDHNQNRLTKVLNSVTDTYAYDNHDHLTGITGSVTKSYTYDNNGNCTAVQVGTGMSAATTSLSYDYENRVTGITFPSSATNSFQYNGADLRAKKVDSSGTKNYITDGTTPGSPVLADGAAVYTPGLSERRGSTSKFYHGDAIGSVRGITDSAQAVTNTTLYDAFGMTVSHTGSTPTPFGFVGGGQYQQDGDSGLMLLGHRYYDPSIGRFISSDPAKAGDNWYAYCDNNPLGKIDPSGLVADEVLPIIRRLIAKGKLPPGTAAEYGKNKGFKSKIHEDIGREKMRGRQRNPDLNEDDIEEIVKDNLPEKLRAELPDDEVWITPEEGTGSQIIDRIGKATGLSGLALALYILISEGSRVAFPPRNLVPVP